ncbi:Transcriptional regulatory protein, C terminal [Variovorax sp. HW608]|uniref:ATP-binding protein n=1 Tax=Variovorax sp. HW608 TaxID=1034889 RepID=UPI00081FA60F|nr:AAA family ATPase [Variovorax sp. HW608]SCK55561.1 Transcriptional regulatory protein, C terminal [Variovorax sp. HW608]
MRTPATGAVEQLTPLRVRFADFELDEGNARLLRGGKPVPLAPTPFSLLCALVRQPGSLVVKDALLASVWGHQFLSESVLKTAVSEVRTALADDAREPRFIETVPRRGYRFIGLIVPTSAAPPVSPAIGDVQPSRSFIGRTGALLRLQRAWQRACNGSERTLVWVTGEPGIGKTTLIEEFVHGLGDISCARGHCVEHHGPAEPYLPLLEALGGLCRADPDLPATLRAMAPTWALQLPWLHTPEEREALRRELAGTGTGRMLREMGEAIERFAQARPLLLVTEDLHWSDPSTVQLIDHIARRRGPARFMWLGTFRLAEIVAQDHPLNRLRHELRVHGQCEEIVLDPFSESEVADFVAQRSPALVNDKAFIRSLHKRTDGVPLFVSSVLDDALEHAGETGTVATRLASVSVPENLAAVIDSYVVRLAPERLALLSAAAVCGLEFRTETVACALDRSPESVGEICVELARQQLWLIAAAHEADAEWGAPYRFRHDLFRHVLYERISPTLRAQLHRKIGAALEAERETGAPVSAAELAMHFDRGGQVLSALRHYAEAARSAQQQQWNPVASMAMTERALELIGKAPANPERDSLEVTLATLHGMSCAQALGVVDAAKDAFYRGAAAFSAKTGHAMRVQLFYGLGYVLCLRAEYPETLALAARTEALAADDDPLMVLVARILQGQVHQLQGQWHTDRPWIDDALAAAGPLSDVHGESFLADPQATLLGISAMQLLHLGRAQEARERMHRARHRARELRQPMTRQVVLWTECLLEVRLGNVERVGVLADEMRALVEEFALAQGRAASRWFRAWADAHGGQALAASEQILQAHEENVRLGMLAGASEVLGYAAEALLLAGEWDRAEMQLKQALDMADSTGERVYLTQLHLLQASIDRARNAPGKARESARRALNEARSQASPWLERTALAAFGELDGAAT